MKPGDIYWIDFPEGAGRAQAGRRPGIVVQGAKASRTLPTVLAVPFTTKLHAARFPGTFRIDPDGENGLRYPSVVLVFQMLAVDKRRIGGLLGRVSERILKTLWQTFDQLTE